MSAQSHAVGYCRVSNAQDAYGVSQQREWIDQAAAREGLKLPAVLDDAGKLLAYCQRQSEAGEPVGIIVTFNTARITRVRSLGAQLAALGVSRLLTAEGWREWGGAPAPASSDN